MADAKTTDEDELIPVEAPIEDEQQATEAEQADDDDEDDGDDRLAQSEDDHEDDIAANTNRERRKQRRDKQRRAREAKEREVAELRQIVLEQQQRLAAVEGHTTQSVVQSLEQKIAQTQSDIRQAEMIIAKATEAGNGEDVVAAMRIRDAANADLMRLSNTREQYNQQRQQPKVPQVDPAVAGYAQQWLAANTWYNPAGTDRDSALTKAIDAEIMAEGYDPKSRDYWEELTSRVAEALGETEPSRPKRKAPPTGKGREHAPVSTRKEIYVTPERKQAMIDAGAWEDPVKRQRMLKAYQAYDNGSAR
jgi:hypothetical protein